MYFAHKIRKRLSFRVIIFLLTISTASIEEDIFFSRMSMQINEHFNPFIFIFLFDQLLQQIYFWMIMFAWLLPLSIEIYSCSRESIVTSTHTIYIYHWNYLYQETLSEKFGMITI